MRPWKPASPNLYLAGDRHALTPKTASDVRIVTRERPFRDAHHAFADTPAIAAIGLFLRCRTNGAQAFDRPSGKHDPGFTTSVIP